MNNTHETIANDFGFHPATGMIADLHDATRANFANLAHWVIDNVPPSEARKQSIHRLRESMMWANGAIACDSTSPEVVAQGPTQ